MLERGPRRRGREDGGGERRETEQRCGDDFKNKVFFRRLSSSLLTHLSPRALTWKMKEAGRVDATPSLHSETDTSHTALYTVSLVNCFVSILGSRRQGTLYCNDINCSVMCRGVSHRQGWRRPRQRISDPFHRPCNAAILLHHIDALPCWPLPLRLLAPLIYGPSHVLSPPSQLDLSNSETVPVMSPMPPLYTFASLICDSNVLTIQNLAQLSSTFRPKCIPNLLSPFSASSFPFSFSHSCQPRNALPPIAATPSPI